MTSSADKQLGYFFCKADNDKMISNKTFVNKVAFYLWNDVFKDYGFEDSALFTCTKEDAGQKKECDLSFPDFFNEDGNPNEDVVKQFVEKVMKWEKEDTKEQDI